MQLGKVSMFLVVVPELMKQLADEMESAAADLAYGKRQRCVTNWRLRRYSRVRVLRERRAISILWPRAAPTGRLLFRCCS